jgi:SHS2 domain-containing protein
LWAQVHERESDSTRESMPDAHGEWRTIEHTADLGIEIEAVSPERLFEAAAHGLAGVLVGSEAGAVAADARSVEVWRDLTLEAPDREALLVDWLRELLHIQESEGLVLAAAEVMDLDDRKLVARAGFRRPGEAGGVERELKGITYHDLEVRRSAAGWYARVIFDL